MPIFARWSQGVHDELKFVADLFNTARNKNPDALKRLKEACEKPLNDGGSRLLVAIRDLAAEVYGETEFEEILERGNYRPNEIDTGWFSLDENIWRFDAILSPDQMHEIRRKAAAELAELSLAGHRVELFTQCNHDRLHVDIYAPAVPDESDPARMWIFVPANSGWMPPKENETEQEKKKRKLSECKAIEALHELATIYPPGPHYGPGTTLRRRLLIEIDGIVSQTTNSHLPYRHHQVPFNWGQGYHSPPPDSGGVVSHRVPKRQEPGVDQSPLESIERPAGSRTGPLVIEWIGEPPAPVQAEQVAALAPTEVAVSADIQWQYPLRWYPDWGVVPESLSNALAGVQANILLPHGRKHVYHILLQIKEGDEAKARAWLAQSAPITSAADELKLVSGSGPSGAKPVVYSWYFSRSGLERLGCPPPPIAQPDEPDESVQPERRDTSDKEFMAGFWEGREGFVDRPPRTIDVMAVVAADEGAQAEAERLRRQLERHGFRLAGLEASRPRERSSQLASGRDERPKLVASEGLLDRVDGISNPRFFTFDIEKASPAEGATLWAAGRSPLIALVPEEGDDVRFGSYFVFQKLRLDPSLLEKEAEVRFGRRPTLPSSTQDSAVDYLIGRRADGSVLWDPVGSGRQANDFTWKTGPFSLPSEHQWMPHIRAVNSRESDPLIVRRSVPYRDEDGSEGLLFGAFMASIKDQFAVIDERARSRNDPFTPSESNAIVTLQDGGFFYAPSPQFIRELERSA